MKRKVKRIRKTSVSELERRKLQSLIAKGELTQKDIDSYVEDNSDEKESESSEQV